MIKKSLLNSIKVLSIYSITAMALENRQVVARESRTVMREGNISRNIGNSNRNIGNSRNIGNNRIYRGV